MSLYVGIEADCQLVGSTSRVQNCVIYVVKELKGLSSEDPDAPLSVIMV